MPPPWAKFDADTWHPLVAHSAEVAAVTSRLLTETQLGRRLARLQSQDRLTARQTQRLCVLAALHDAGKCNRGFQNKRWEKQPQAGHVAPIIGMLQTKDRWRMIKEALPLERMETWFGDRWDLMDWLQTTWSHHGTPVPRQTVPSGVWDEQALKDMAAMATWVQDWYPEAFEDAAVVDAPAAQHLFNGVLTLADWIASDTSLFPMDPALVHSERAMQTAEDRARDAVEDLALTGLPDPDLSLAFLLGGNEPYDVQRDLQAQPVSREGTLSVMESPTGSGKTEAALGRYASLLKDDQVDGLYFAVPTRAAAKQLHTRATNLRNRMFGTSRPPVHLAVPGYLKVDDTEGTRFGWSVRWDSNVGAKGWAAESSKRYTSSPIAVGTIDQVLMAALKTKHAHLRMAGLSRSLLVVDEVHASSAYMNELLQTVVTLHRDMGGHVLLMSATLGSGARAAFTGEPVPPYEKAKEEAYPLITHVNGSDPPEQCATTAQPGNGKTVAIDFKPWMSTETQGETEDEPGTRTGPISDLVCLAETAAEAGAHVLIIRNTVAACRAIHDAIDPQFSLSVRGTAAPHHSRYAAADREVLDIAIEESYGKHEAEDGTLQRKQKKGVVTVATQTVEQSLDIDADLLITDLCPMDVLLQRIGRLHRHRREDRPAGYEPPAQCVVLTPTDEDLRTSIHPTSGKGFPGPGLGSVYPDLRIIDATWTTLRHWAKEGVVIPRDNRELVEAATHPEVLARITESDARWEAHARYLRTEKREEVIGAKNNTIRFQKRFTADDNQFSGRRLKTRLGQEDIAVTLPGPVKTPFGNTAKELSLSPYLFKRGHRPDDGLATSLTTTNEGFRFEFAGHWFAYTTKGIEKAAD